MNLFYELHKDIPREGPGNNESTKKAFEMIRNRVREWRKFLKNNGILVASELSWIKKNPPKDL